MIASQESEVEERVCGELEAAAADVVMWVTVLEHDVGFYVSKPSAALGSSVSLCLVGLYWPLGGPSCQKSVYAADVVCFEHPGKPKAESKYRQYQHVDIVEQGK